jgi:hypothetical protein
MIAFKPACLSLMVALLLPAGAWAGPLQRYTLIVGANSGGADRPQLQYAVSDAERFARVLVELGGVLPANEIVLKEPKVRDLVDALDRLSARVAAGRRAAGGRTEVLVYYSGHADEKGLLLGEDRFSYQSLRDRLDEIPADVRIAVLDACASGAFTRIKGGKSRPPFLVNQSANMRGHAFLTSSAATEAAQESDRIKASYFTHYLVSGFRGAADMSGDGQVTLNEAYQFAFTETLGRTVDSKGGAQHPSYDINLSGAGDVVMTDVRQTTATLVLDENLEGRFFVRTGQALVVELYKPRGRKVELALEPGSYEVRVEIDKAARLARAQVADGSRVVLGERQFGTTTLEATRQRGADETPRFSVDGRSRFAMLVGGWGSHGTVLGGSSLDLVSGLQYTKYLRENLAFTFAMQSFGAESVQGILGGFAAPAGVRWNPLRGNLATHRVKPFLTVGALPVTQIESQRYAIGFQVGAGADVHLSRSFSLGASLGYNAFPTLGDNPRHDDFKGREITIGFGWLFGQPRRATP